MDRHELEDFLEEIEQTTSTRSLGVSRRQRASQTVTRAQTILAAPSNAGRPQNQMDSLRSTESSDSVRPAQLFLASLVSPQRPASPEMHIAESNERIKSVVVSSGSSRSSQDGNNPEEAQTESLGDKHVMMMSTSPQQRMKPSCVINDKEQGNSKRPILPLNTDAVIAVTGRLDQDELISLREAMEVSRVLSSLHLPTQSGPGWRGESFIGKSFSDDEAQRDDVVDIEQGIREIAGGAVRKSSECFDQIQVVCHYLETLFAPVDTETAAFLTKYASLHLFCRFSTAGSDTGNANDQAHLPSLLDRSMTSKGFESLLRDVDLVPQLISPHTAAALWLRNLHGSPKSTNRSRSSSPTKVPRRFSPDKVQSRLSPPRKSRFAGKEAADAHDYDGFQQTMLLLFDIIRDRSAARGHVSNDDSVGSPGKDYRSRSGGGGGGGGEFPWQMRKVGGGYKKVLIVPAEAREQASAATAKTLRHAGEVMQQQVFVLAQQLMRHRAEALRLADLLQSEQVKTKELASAVASAEQQACELRDKLAAKAREWELESNDRDRQAGRLSASLTQREKMIAEAKESRNSLQIRVDDLSLQVQTLSGELATERQQSAGLDVLVFELRDSMDALKADKAALAAVNKRLEQEVHEFQDLAQRRQQQEAADLAKEKIARGILEEEVCRLRAQLLAGEKAEEARTLECEAAEEARQLREEAEKESRRRAAAAKAVMRWQNASLSTSWDQWWLQVGRSRLAKKVVRRLMQRCLTTAWNCWERNVAEAHADRLWNAESAAHMEARHATTAQLLTLSSVSAKGLGQLHSLLEDAHALLSDVHADTARLLSDLSRAEKEARQAEAREHLVVKVRDELREQQIERQAAHQGQVLALQQHVDEVQDKMTRRAKDHEQQIALLQGQLSEHEGVAARMRHMSESAAQALLAHTAEHERQMQEERERGREARAREAAALRAQMDAAISERDALGAHRDALIGEVKAEKQKGTDLSKELAAVLGRESVVVAKYTAEMERHRERDVTDSVRGREAEEMSSMLMVMSGVSQLLEGTVEQIVLDFEAIAKKRREDALLMECMDRQGQQLREDNRVLARHVKKMREDTQQMKTRAREREENVMAEKELVILSWEKERERQQVKVAEEERQRLEGLERAEEETAKAKNLSRQLQAKLDVAQENRDSLQRQVNLLQNELMHTKAALDARDVEFKHDLHEFQTRIISLSASGRGVPDACSAGKGFAKPSDDARSSVKAGKSLKELLLADVSNGVTSDAGERVATASARKGADGTSGQEAVSAAATSPEENLTIDDNAIGGMVEGTTATANDGKTDCPPAASAMSQIMMLSAAGHPHIAAQVMGKSMASLSPPRDTSVTLSPIAFVSSGGARQGGGAGLDREAEKEQDGAIDDCATDSGGQDLEESRVMELLRDAKTSGGAPTGEDVLEDQVSELLRLRASKEAETIFEEHHRLRLRLHAASRLQRANREEMLARTLGAGRPEAQRIPGGAVSRKCGRREGSASKRLLHGSDASGDDWNLLSVRQRVKVREREIEEEDTHECEHQSAIQRARPAAARVRQDEELLEAGRETQTRQNERARELQDWESQPGMGDTGRCLHVGLL